MLRIDEQGDLEFTYAEAWLADLQARAISISLPKRAEPFNRRETRPFFAGLRHRRLSGRIGSFFSSRWNYGAPTEVDNERKGD
jgi:hypothetical protein